MLASKKGEGIFGVTYSATGNADQPKISVNPLSVLTPGILRRIFQGHIPNAGQCAFERSTQPPTSAGATSPGATPPLKPEQPQLERLHQHVFLLAAGEFEHAVAVKRRRIDHQLGIAHRRIVQLQAIVGDQLAGFGIGRRQSRRHGQVQNPVRQFGA